MVGRVFDEQAAAESMDPPGPMRMAMDELKPHRKRFEDGEITLVEYREIANAVVDRILGDR